MGKNQKLTSKQKALIKYKAEGLTNKEAAIKAGYSNSYASTTINNDLREDKLAIPIQQLMDRKGLSDDALLNKHKQLLDAVKPFVKSNSEGIQEVIDIPDSPIQMKALETAYKLKRYIGSGEEEGGGKPNISIQVIKF